MTVGIASMLVSCPRNKHVFRPGRLPGQLAVFQGRATIISESIREELSVRLGASGQGRTGGPF